MNDQYLVAPFRGRTLRRTFAAMMLGFLLIAAVARGLLAADIVDDEIYRLEAGTTAADDLYVFGREVYIDGTVDGDLVVFAGYVEINGVVTGDMTGAAGSIVINGAVGDDVRVAGSGIVITGNVADDLFAAGGGGRFAPMIGAFGVGRTVVPGVRLLSSAVVNADAYLAGGSGLVEGSVGRDLVAGFETLEFSGRVARDARLYAQTLTVGDGASVGGTLHYSTAEPVALPQGVAANVVAEPWEVDDAPDETGFVEGALWWLLRTLMAVLGIVVVGWLWLRFWATGLARPASAIVQRPVESALWGAVLLMLAIPFSAGLVFVAVLFWNWFPGGVSMLALTFGALAWVWLLSPLPVGYALSLWLGSRGLSPWDNRVMVLIMTALVVVVARLLALAPFAGAFAAGVFQVIVVAFALGGLALTVRNPDRPQNAAPAPAPETTAQT